MPVGVVIPYGIVGEFIQALHKRKWEIWIWWYLDRDCGSFCPICPSEWYSHILESPWTDSWRSPQLLECESPCLPCLPLIFVSCWESNFWDGLWKWGHQRRCGQVLNSANYIIFVVLAFLLDYVFLETFAGFRCFYGLSEGSFCAIILQLKWKRIYNLHLWFSFSG